MVKNVFKLLLALNILLGLAACGSALPTVKPYKMDIQQGNVVTSKMLLQLRPGMTKSQVRYILGTPLILDSFHNQRWDYFYQLRQGGKVVEQRRVILDFEKDQLVRVRGDVVPQGTPGAVSGEPPLSKSVVQPATKNDKGLLDRLKFWKSDDKANAKPAEVNPGATKSPEPTGNMPVEAPAAVLPGAATQENNDAESPAAEMPSVLAVPIGGGEPTAPPVQVVPVTPEPAKPAPEVSAPVEPIPAVVPVVVPETPKAEVVAPAPAKYEAATPSSRKSTPPASTKPNEKLIFRMDNTLDTRNLEAAPVAEPVAAPTPAPEAAPVQDSAPKKKKKKTDEEPLPPETEPTFFDRMLEKIGF